MHTTPLRRPRRRSTGPGRVPPSHEEIPVTRRKTAAHANHERWLVSYADFMTLLFAFFVVMFASTQNDKYKARDVSDSVRQALEHGQLSAAISTVLGRGKHEARKAPWSKETTNERENPNAPPPSPPETHPPDLAKSLDTLQRGLDSDLKNGKLQLRLDARGLIISMREKAFFASGDDAIAPQPGAAGRPHRRAADPYLAISQQLGALDGAQHRHAGVDARSFSDSAVPHGRSRLRGKLSGRHQ